MVWSDDRCPFGREREREGAVRLQLLSGEGKPLPAWPKKREKKKKKKSKVATAQWCASLLCLPGLLEGHVWKTGRERQIG